MEESAYYVGSGNPSDKQSQESFAHVNSIHNSKPFQSFRQADCQKNGSVLTGIGPGERCFVASRDKALIQVYLWGKESVDQRLPIPEPLNCLELVYMNKPISTVGKGTGSNGSSSSLPNYRIPWLLIGGSKTGKLYMWELTTGNLVFVKDIHYQSINTVRASKCGTFIITASDDSRCIIYKTMDLVSIYSKSADFSPKPYFTITDHSLPVTDMLITDGLISDISVCTVSKDCTLRVYNLLTKSLLLTFIVPDAIECVAKDPGNRYFYVGLSNGAIRIIPMYKQDNFILHKIGNMGDIITLEADPELNHSIVTHQPHSITQLKVSLDGMSLISGDVQGNVYVSDIVSKQITKNFKISSSISYIQVAHFPLQLVDNSIKSGSGASNVLSEKNKRLIPPLKRVLADNNGQLSHELILEIPPNLADNDNKCFEEWIDAKAKEELDLKLESVQRAPAALAATASDDHEKLSRLSKAYSDLKQKYDELLQDHKKLMS